MIRKIMEDIKNEKPNIITIIAKDNKISSYQAPREIPPPKNFEETKPSNHVHERREAYKIPATPRTRRKKNSVRKSLLWLLGISLILGAIYWISDFFQHARITIVEKHQILILDYKQYGAMKDSNSAIHFEVMIISAKGSKDMVLSQYENASLKAKGEITLYNEFSTKPLTLANNSFISDSTGKVYTLDQAVTLPGYVLKNGKIVSGTGLVSITSFLPGATYNIPSPTDFTINAYKGTPKFTKIYGKSTNPITGGSQGLSYTLSPEDRGSLNGYAQSTFKSNLLKNIDAEVPKGYILYPNVSSFSYEIDDTIQAETPNARIGIKGTMSAVLLKEDDLRKTVVKSLLPSAGESELNEISIPDLPNLTFNFVDPNQMITKELNNFQFTLTGKLEAIWHPDVNALRQKFIGIDKDLIPSLFKSDPGIASAGVKLFPPWQSHLPENPAKIHIKVQ